MFRKGEFTVRRNRILCLLIAVVMAVLACGPAYALKATTLCRGSKGENVRLLQQALISFGYLSGQADTVTLPRKSVSGGLDRPAGETL